MMNKDRILELADHVGGLRHGHDAGAFDMRGVTHDCGSPSCIAGWAVHMFGDREDRMNPSVARARVLLGLDYTQSYELFCPENDYAHVDARAGDSNFVDPERAADCLRRLAETWQVEWDEV